MRYLIAMDSFKGSLTSLQAGAAVQEAIGLSDANAQVTLRPLADGGEGTVDAVSAGLGGEIVELSVCGPLQEPILAKYCILPDRKTAVIEMAAAAGLPLVPPEKRDPLETTTYGVGELIKDAILRGCRHFLIGIGGSATNDDGFGMLQALGYEFLNSNENLIPLGAKGLADLTQIRTELVMPELSECTFRIACDVTNPLCGKNGCSAVFGPQKGATPTAIVDMDRWLKSYAAIAAKVSDRANAQHPGAGAAGGLGFAFLSFTNATLESGVKIILEETNLERYIENTDIVITGEGRLDGQTVMGKAPIGVAKLAKKHGKKVLAFAGCLGEGVENCLNHGIDAYFSISPEDMPLQEAMKPDIAYGNLRDTVYRALHSIS